MEFCANLDNRYGNSNLYSACNVEEREILNVIQIIGFPLVCDHLYLYLYVDVEGVIIYDLGDVCGI